MRLLYITIVLFTAMTHLFGQGYTYGHIFDQNENVIANVKITEVGTENVTYSNDLGEYALRFFGDSAEVLFVYSGFDSLVLNLHLGENRTVFLQSKLDNNDYHLGFLTGFLDFSNKNKNKNLENMPYFLGESDVNRQLQMLPGIEQGTEGYSNLLIRGGDVDQNLMLYNGTPIYNFNHLFGLSSTFHNKSIKNTKVYRGISPAKYGGRLSSYIELESEKTGNYSGLDGEFEMTPLNAGIYISNIKKGEGFFTLAARRSWLDLLTPIESRQNSLNVNIYDVQLNFGKTLNAHDKIEVNLMNTRDFYFVGGGDDSTQNLSNTRVVGITQKWSNILASIKYKQRLSPLFKAEHQVYYSGYNTSGIYKEEIFDRNINTIPTTSNEINRGIRDLGLQTNWTYLKDHKNTLHFGVQSSTKFFQPGKSTYISKGYPTIDDINTVSGNTKYTASNEIALYAEDHWRLDEKTYFDVGFRQVQYIYNRKLKFAFEPRIHATFFLHNKDVLKLGYNRHNQFLGQLNLGTIGRPDNIWIPTTQTVKPSKLDILEASYERKLGLKYAGSLNIYSKTMRDIIQVANLREAANPDLDWQSSVVSGKGRSFGAELLLQKSQGYITGWLSYAYSRSFREFTDLYDEEYLYNFDRPHMLKLYVNYTDPFSDWNFGINYVLGSGQLFTLPIGKFRDINGNTQLEYDELNNYRSGVYQRFDLSVIRLKNSYGVEQEWRFYLYNAFGNRNPLSIAADFDNGNLASPVQIERAFLAFVPGIAYIVKL